MAAPPLPVSPRQGDLVWGKLGRYPPWPGKIVPPPKDMTKPQGKKGYFVKFFGTENHAWIKVEHLKPYHAHKEEMTKTGKGKRFQQAVVSVDEYIKKVKARELAREQAKEQSSEDQKKSRPSSEKKSKKIAEKHKLVGKAKKNSGDLKKRILASDLKKFLASDLKKKILANELKKKVLAREMKKMLSDGIKKKSQSADGKKKVLASDGKKKIVKKILIANGKQKIVAKKSVPKKILPKKILAGASKKKTTSSGGKKIVSSDGKKRKILLADSKKKKIVLANGKSKNLSIEGKKKLLTGNKKKLSVEGKKKKVLSGNGKKKILSDKKKNMLLLSSKSQLKGLDKENSRKRGRPSKEPGASGSSTMKRMAMGTLAGFKWQSEYSEPVKDDPHFHHFLLSQTERLVTNRAISKRFKLSDDEMRSTSIQAADSTAANDIINPTDKMIGFLGLGLMGSGIVSNLLKMGHSVTVWNRTAEKCNLFVEEGAGLGRTPAEVVSNCDITFSCVADPQAARDLVLGPSGVLHGIRPGKCYVDLSTVDPETVVKVSREIVSRGGRFLEAPVSGNQQLSNEGMLVILAAGDQGLYEDCSSCFQAMGRASFFLGEVGSAAKMMLILSMMQGSFMATIAEGLTLAHITGQSQQTLLDILNQSPLASNFLDQKCQNILQGNFKPDSYLKYTQKDLRLAIALGDSVNLPTPMAAAANEVYKRAKALDQSDNDMSAVCRAYIH